MNPALIDIRKLELRNLLVFLVVALGTVIAISMFQDVTRQQIEQVVDALHRLDTHAGVLAERLDQFENADFELVPLSQHLDQMHRNYVMSSQRDSHHAAMGAALPQENGNEAMPA